MTMRTSTKVILSLVVIGLMAAAGFAFAGEPGQGNPAKQGYGKHREHAARAFLKRLAEMDTNKDKQVSRDEFLTGTMKRFDAVDANHDGFVTKEEIQAAVKDLGGQVFGKVDKNGDGKIGKDEFPGKPERFAALDKNGDGFLTKEELQAAGDKIRERLGDRKPGERIWGRLDTNNDGKVSRDEFQIGMTQVFSLLDRNGDGVISKADRGPRPLAQGDRQGTARKTRGSGSGPALP
jgi:Ca2+-binding EF-hand superfamily protein